ncbi:MAG: permease-like cell division protein FtsX [Candidatus Lernaella stagnicola]|nr:permease-like cell division protein FtsX [Candidatus Lernaella stagnicola]
MKSAIEQFVSRSARNIRADLGANITTILAVGLAVSIPLVFSLLAVNLGALVDAFVGEVEVVAYISIDASQGQIDGAVARIGQMPEVKSVTLVTSEMALKRFAEELPEVADVVRELGENPLPPSLEIILHRGFDNRVAMDDFAGRVAQLPGVVEVDDGRRWIDRLSRFIRYTWALALVMGLFLSLAAGLLVANTIRLAIYRRRDEIGIYRLVGATKGFIRGPLLAEGVFQGVVGSLLALGLCYGLYRYILHRVSRGDSIRDWLLGGVNLIWPGWTVVVAVLALGGAIGLVASYLSTRRFLRV